MHGLSAQAVRNYERDGVLPPAGRSSTGYRRLHAKALSAYLALIRAHGYAAGGEIMRAVNRGEIGTALRAIDHSHALLQRDRETLGAVEAVVTVLTGTKREPHGRKAVPISALAHRLGVRPATLRKPDPSSRSAIPRPATASTRQTTSATPNSRTRYAAAGTGSTTSPTCCIGCATPGGSEPLAASLRHWRDRLTERGRAMLTGAARLAEYIGSGVAPTIRPG